MGCTQPGNEPNIGTKSEGNRAINILISSDCQTEMQIRHEITIIDLKYLNYLICKSSHERTCNLLF